MPDSIIELPWITEARKYIGQREIPGLKNNPIILRFWDLIHAPFKDDETPWCAGFVGACLEAVEIRSTRSAAALSYKSYGEAIATPFYGCIATKPRFNASGRLVGGHVCFVVGRTPTGKLLCLGGNQGDSVSIVPYPASVFNAFRMPAGAWERQTLPVITLTTSASTEA